MIVWETGKEACLVEYRHCPSDSSVPYIPWRTDEQTDSIARCVGLVTNQDGLQSFDCDGWSHLCEIPIDQILRGMQGNGTGDGESEATRKLSDFTQIHPTRDKNRKKCSVSS